MRVVDQLEVRLPAFDLAADEGGRLLLAPDPAADLPRDPQLRRRHAADEEHLRRGDPQAVRAGGAQQGPDRLQNSFASRPQERGHPGHHDNSTPSPVSSGWIDHR